MYKKVIIRKKIIVFAFFFAAAVIFLQTALKNEDAAKTSVCSLLEGSDTMVVVFDGRLDLAQQRRKATRLIKTAGGEIRLSYSSAGIYTMYGYIREADRYIKVNKEKINIQIAFSYEEDKDKTVMQVAMPILMGSY